MSATAVNVDADVFFSNLEVNKYCISEMFAYLATEVLLVLMIQILNCSVICHQFI